MVFMSNSAENSTSILMPQLSCQLTKVAISMCPRKLIVVVALVVQIGHIIIGPIAIDWKVVPDSGSETLRRPWHRPYSKSKWNGAKSATCH